ncbi:MAG: hypothetical protein HGA71_08305 [Azonexaceae bacterium]|nr:hypothetical protein [Azonexaceae bacterium]
MKKTIIAAIIAATASVSAFAATSNMGELVEGKIVESATVSASGVVTGSNVNYYIGKPGAPAAVGDVSIRELETKPIEYGPHTAAEFQQMTFETKVTVVGPAGTKVEICPVFKESARIGSDGVNVVPPEHTGQVVMRLFRDDGVTPITPDKCWPVVANDEPVMIKAKVTQVGTHVVPIDATFQLISVKYR